MNVEGPRQYPHSLDRWKSVQRPVLVSEFPLTIDDCRHNVYFGPCDRLTYVAGVVKDAKSAQPIESASVHIDDDGARLKASECFALGTVPSRPLVLRVTAAGYKPVAFKLTPGTYLATVTLMPAGSPVDSSLAISGVSRPHYTELERDCYN